MKRIVFLLISFFCTFATFAQEFITIKGKVHNPDLTKVKLFKTVDGNIQTVATTTLTADGRYGFLVAPEKPGFYAVGTEKMNFIIYLQGKEEVNIDLYKTDAKLNGRNSKENKVLYLWNDYAATVRLKSVNFLYIHSNYKDFFPDFEKFLAGMPELKKKLKSGNAEFDKKMMSLVQYQTDFFATSLLMTPRTEHPQKSQYPAYYSTIYSADKFATDEVLEFPQGTRMMQSYVSFCCLNTGEQPKGADEYTAKCLSMLQSPRLKGEYVMNNCFSRYKSYEQFLQGMKEYEQYLVTPSLKARAEEVGTKLYQTNTGAMAADFTYPDVNGKMVSLSDFKGKVVLVDVWATWCGPCKKEIPHLIKLEKEMHGTDLVVLGVSLDEAKDKQKWLDFIKEKGLTGVQVHASGWSKVTKDYKITGIPRFMVFDKNGNIVSTNAPRPSDPALKEMLKKELKK